MGIGDERSFPQIISVHFTLTTKESTIPSRGVNQCMKSSCKRKNKFIAFAGGSWLALNKELKQHRRRRLRKRHLKSEVALLQTLSRLFHRVKFVKFWQFFSGVEFQKTVSKYRKRKRKSLSCAHVLNISPSQSCSDGKQMYKKAWFTCKVVVLPT